MCLFFIVCSVRSVRSVRFGEEEDREWNKKEKRNWRTFSGYCTECIVCDTSVQRNWNGSASEWKWEIFPKNRNAFFYRFVAVWRLYVCVVTGFGSEHFFFRWLPGNSFEFLTIRKPFVAWCNQFNSIPWKPLRPRLPKDMLGIGCVYIWICLINRIIGSQHWTENMLYWNNQYWNIAENGYKWLSMCV